MLLVLCRAGWKKFFVLDFAEHYCVLMGDWNKDFEPKNKGIGGDFTLARVLDFVWKEHFSLEWLQICLKMDISTFLHNLSNLKLHWWLNFKLWSNFQTLKYNFTGENFWKCMWNDIQSFFDHNSSLMSYLSIILKFGTIKVVEWLNYSLYLNIIYKMWHLTLFFYSGLIWKWISWTLHLF